MVSGRDIRERLLEYLLGELSLDEFEDWIVQHTWNVNQWGSKDTRNLAYSIEAKLAEHSGDHISEKVLRKNLLPLAQGHVVSVDTPQLSTR